MNKDDTLPIKNTLMGDKCKGNSLFSEGKYEQALACYSADLVSSISPET